MATHRTAWALLICGNLLASVCWAQQDALSRFERQLEQINRDTRLLIDPDIPIEQRTLFEYGGYASFYFLAIDDAPNQNTHILRQTDLTTFARLSLDGVHQFFIRGRMTYRDFNHGDSFDGDGDDLIGPELERALYRFDYRRATEAYDGRTTDYNFILTGGRQLAHWGNGLVISKDIDGAVVDIEYGPVTLQALAGRTRQRQVDFDSSRPSFDDDMRRNFFGGMLSAKIIKPFNPYAYGLVQVDQNRDEILSAGGTSTRFNYDSHYIGIGAAGNIGNHIVYGVEAAYEGGQGLSAVAADGTQSTDAISAWAADGRLEYLVNDGSNTRFTLEAVLASGDRDRGHSSNTFAGNTAGTADTGFNAFGLINTGMAFAPSVSNLALLRVGASTFPLQNTDWFKRLQVGIDLIIYNKLMGDAPIDEPTDSNHFLGVEPDLYANWQVTSDFALTMRYGIFFPGSGIQFNDHPRNFFYTGVTLAF